jgi:hypothetical protein
VTAATALTVAPARRPRARRVPLAWPGLLRLELRRNIMPWLLPLIVALFWFDSFRSSLGGVPLWSARTFISLGQGHDVIDFGPFVAGAAAWMGSREVRSRTTDLVSVTPVARWTARLAAWAATICWIEVPFLACVGLMFWADAHQGTWGGPPWWPVAADAVGVAALASLGFAAGALLPGRFAAPTAAFGAFIALVVASHIGFDPHSSPYAQILPMNGQGLIKYDTGVFYPFLPDVSIVRLIFLSGLILLALGVLGLPPASEGRTLRRAAAAVTVAGLAATGTAIGLAGTARLEANGVVIPALHDAASDRAIPYTPVCGGSAVPVCVHPAYRSYLPDVTAALDPVLGQVAGLPGAPARVVQVPTSYLDPTQPASLAGRPTVLRLPLGDLALASAGRADSRAVQQMQLLFTHAFVGAGAGIGTPAQQAVQAALLNLAGLPQSALLSVLPYFEPQHASPISLSPPVQAAAQRLAALPAAARHAWLAGHLGALRSGRLTLGQLP